MTLVAQPTQRSNLEMLRRQLLDWLTIVEPPKSPTASDWNAYIEEIHAEPWRMENKPADSLKVSLYTAENRYLLLVRPEGTWHSLTVYCLSRHPFKDEQPFNPDSFISGGEFSLETLYGCLMAILERELIAKV
jgi:hypothetical protein